MADKFLNTGQGAVNLTNGTVNIIAAELGAVNLVPSKTLKTNATKQIVSADLEIDDITNLQSELTTKTELNFVESDIARVTPAAGELKLYAKSDNHLYKMDDTGDEKQLGNVFSTGTSVNHALAIFQGGSGEHITDSAITYNPNTNGLVDVTIISNYSNEILLLPSGMQLISPSLTINAVTDLYNNALNNVASLNGIVPANILQNNGTTPMAAAYTPTTAQDVATKTYVDTHSTSNNYLKIDGSSVMSGNLRLGNNNILGAYDIQTTSISDVGSQIDINTGLLKINGGNGDCELRICADENNNNENYNSRIVFQQDGSYQEAAVWMGDNQLNLSSSISDGGINFRTTTTDNVWETAPVRMSINTGGEVTIENTVRIRDNEVIELGYGLTKELHAGKIGYQRFSSAVDIIGAGLTGGGDRQIKMWEDVSCKALTETSDERLKYHIRPIETKMAGSLIDNLQPKCYMWKNIDSITGEETEFKDHHCYMGLIAQEVKAVQDDIGDAMGEKLRISRNAKSEQEYMSITYTQLIAPMLKCIQDLRARVAVLESK